MRQPIGWKTVALVCLLLGISSLGGSLPTEGAVGQLTVLTFGEPMAPGPGPLLIDGRVYVAAEVLAETLGLTLEWEHASSTLYLNSYRGEALAKPLGRLHGYPELNLLVNDELLPSTAQAILVRAVPYLPLRIAEAFGLQVGWHPAARIAYIGSPDKQQLPRIGSIANLEKLLIGGSRYGYYREGMVLTDSASNKGEFSITGAAPAMEASPEHSFTNTQVQGVDEADIIKTDGSYLYQVKRQSVLISQSYPESELRLVCSIDLGSENITPSELFIDGDQLLVIGQSAWHDDPRVQISEKRSSSSPSSPSIWPMPPYYWQQKTSVLVYDITDRALPALTRTVELGGSYLTARKVDSRVVLLANQPLYGGPIGPCFRDSATDEGLQSLPIPDIQYFPERLSSSYLLTATFDLSENEQPAAFGAYLGAGDNVYMSQSNLYVTASRWWGNESSIYKLHLEGTSLSFQAKGTVPGRLLNQFSLDEWNGDLRVATTYDQDGKTQNGVYVLDDQLNLIGKQEGIAPGERIYAARFMGERGYLVTFEQVDPLFVLDLSDGSHPSILGALKIPGFSTYLHPLDQHHLLGIGRDTMLLEEKDKWGKVVATRVLEKGLKLAIFDVTDLSNPEEKFGVLLGGRGSQSEALYNHKAVFYSEPLQLLALPVHLTAATPTAQDYGPAVFQGAVVFQVNTEQGFTELGRVTHLTPDDLRKSGYYGNNDQLSIRRILTIERSLYAVSEGRITAHSIDSLEQINSITLP